MSPILADQCPKLRGWGMDYGDSANELVQLRSEQMEPKYLGDLTPYLTYDSKIVRN
jgi:hypothetical protein